MMTGNGPLKITSRIHIMIFSLDDSIENFSHEMHEGVRAFRGDYASGFAPQ